MNMRLTLRYHDHTTASIYLFYFIYLFIYHTECMATDRVRAVVHGKKLP